MKACECSTKETHFARVKFSNGHAHFVEVCNTCGGNVRGKSTYVAARELRARGIEPDNLSFVPEEQTHRSFDPRQRGLFDDAP